MFAPSILIGTYLIFIGCKLDKNALEPSWVSLFIPCWFFLLLVTLLGIIYAAVWYKLTAYYPIPILILAMVSAWTFIIEYPLVLENKLDWTPTESYIPLFISSGSCIIYAFITRLVPLNL